MDRVRESLFNVLVHRDWGREIGDLFGGETALHNDGIGARFLHGLEGPTNIFRSVEHHNWVNLNAGGAARKLELIDERS